jgi:ankyrin repeat protein
VPGLGSRLLVFLFLFELIQMQSMTSSNCRPTTILTNLQRGNVRTRLAPESSQNRSFFERAARGELQLQELRSDTIDCVDHKGLTALMWACANGQLNSVRLLISSGANVTARGPNGESPLLLAAAGGHVHIVRELLVAGSCADDQDNDGTSALMFACAGDHASTVNELLRVNADPTTLNVQGDSALGIAFRMNACRSRIALERKLLSLLEILEC